MQIKRLDIGICIATANKTRKWYILLQSKTIAVALVSLAIILNALSPLLQ